MVRKLVVVLVVVLVAAGVAGCEGGPPAASCGGQACAADQRCDADTLTCVPDQAPVVTLAQVQGVVTSESFVVTGTARDDVKVTSATWSVGAAASQPVTVGSDGSFSLTVPAPLVDEQSITVEVKATDGAREGRASIQVRVDRVGPAIELVSPDVDEVIGGPGAQVSVRATDASGALAALTVADQPLASPPHGVPVSAPVAVPANLAAELFPVVVSATDAHGNVTTRTFSVLGDSTPPVVTVTLPAADDVFVTTSTLRLEGTVADTTLPLQVRVEGLDAGVTLATLTGDGGAWFAELPVPLRESTDSVRVEAEDSVGNVAAATRQVRVDRVAPTVSITAPAAGTLHRVALSVTATTAGDAHTVEARLGTGAAVTLTGGPTSWSGSVPAPAQDYAGLDLSVTVRDEAGNSSEATVSLFVDTVAPVIAFASPAEGRKFNIADFATTNDVPVSWTVQDADPQAGVTQVNGAASTATQLLVTTSASDNGRVVTTTVTAADRAGNTSTATRTFSVDRVRPTVTTWTPAHLARNVEPRVTSISFSEPVYGATTATDALALSPAGAGTWNAAHSTWTSAALTPYTVYVATLAAGALADDHGNSVDPASRRFSTSVFAPTGPSDTLLLSNVRDFRAAADADGAVTLAVRRQSGVIPGFSVLPISRQTAAITASIDSDTGNVTDYGLNAWSLVDPATLVPRHVVGATWFIPCSTTPCFNIKESRRYENNVAVTLPGVGYDVVLSQPALFGEQSGSEVGVVAGTNYQRGSAAVTLPLAPRHLAAQSSASWAAFTSTASSLRWTRFTCYRVPSPPGARECWPYEFATSTSATPTAPTVALNSAGQCLVASWTEGSARRAVFQPLNDCSLPRLIDLASCINNTSLPSVARAGGFAVAPFTTASESTLLAAWQDTGGGRLAKMTTPSACSDAFTSLGLLAISNAVDLAPVQVGQRAGLLYTTTSGDLRLAFP